ncbi:RadC family protein [Butyrivibrio sp. NC3005]|uniref:RadC family protein n=1 Tax=Butyrivibrio sp. NC3005 TaxID=1280685 RepID=UPI0004100AE8|nr:DNA repair protein RadC [Butyrivibrio sp. NC3005]
MSHKKSLSNMLQDGSASIEALPFERFRKYGPETLTDAELLAVLIRCGTLNSTPMEIGQEVLKRGSIYEKGLNGLHHLSVKELCEINGIGEVKAIQLKAIGEIARRMSVSSKNDRLCCNNPTTVAKHYMEMMRHEEREQLRILSLGTHLELKSDKVIYQGTADRCLIEPRDIFQFALRAGAVSIILLHNHPSGDPTPSNADCKITKRISTLGKELGIILQDHIIIGDNKYISFRENKLLDFN